MGTENARRAWKLILLMCFVHLYSVSSNPVVENVKDVQKDEPLMDKTKLCGTVQVLSNSSYVVSCNTLIHPKTFNQDDPKLALCMIVYDTMNKICEYSSKLPYTKSKTALLPETVQELDKDIEKFENTIDSPEICKNISSIFNKLNHSKVEGIKELIPYLQLAQQKLLTKEQCTFTCHTFVNGKKLNHLCTYLLWANKFFNSLKPINDKNDQEDIEHVKELHPNPKKDIQENPKSNEKQDAQVVDTNISSKKTDNISNVVKEPKNQENKQKLPSSTIKKSDVEPKQAAATISTSNNDPKNKPNDQKQLEEANNHGSLQEPPKKEDAPENPKKGEDEVDNPHLPPEEMNQETDFNSVEEQNKKEIEDLDENADNEQKELNNQDVGVPVKNPDDNEEIQNAQKFVPHPLTLKDDEESHFFTYFSFISIFCIVLYIGYHNKQKIFAIFLEGRRSRRGRTSRRRPSTASYRKLDCNLEEAVTSQCNSNVTHVIY